MKMNALSPTGTAMSWLQERRNTVALLGILGLVAALVAGWSSLPTQAQPTIAPFTDIADEDHLAPEVYQSFGRRPDSSDQAVASCGCRILGQRS
jgi:hypothetical protein